MDDPDDDVGVWEPLPNAHVSTKLTTDQRLEAWWRMKVAQNPRLARTLDRTANGKVGRWHRRHKFLAIILWSFIAAVILNGPARWIFGSGIQWPPPTVARYNGLFMSAGESFNNVDPTLLAALATVNTCGNPEFGFDKVKSLELGVMGNPAGMVTQYVGGSSLDLRDPAQSIFMAAENLAICARPDPNKPNVGKVGTNNLPSLPEFLTACSRFGGPYAVSLLRVPRSQWPPHVVAYIDTVMAIYGESKANQPPTTFRRLLKDDTLYQSLFPTDSSDERYHNRTKPRKVTFQKLCREASQH